KIELRLPVPSALAYPAGVINLALTTVFISLSSSSPKLLNRTSGRLESNPANSGSIKRYACDAVGLALLFDPVPKLLARTMTEFETEMGEEYTADSIPGSLPSSV